MVLHKALQEAMQREYIDKNPASIAVVPTLKSQNVKKKEIEIYSKDEQNKLIETAKSNEIYGTVVICALYTGMRRGELLGLQWADINFDNNTIKVNKQIHRIKNYESIEDKKTILDFEYNTKTANSTRTISMMPCLVEILKEHKVSQEKYAKLFKSNYNKYNLVFCRENGMPLDPDTLSSKYHKLSEKAKIKQCTFHALRHTFATRALESGMPAKIVSKILGHSSVELTLDTYTHVLPDIQANELNKLNEYLKPSSINS